MNFCQSPKNNRLPCYYKIKEIHKIKNLQAHIIKQINEKHKIDLIMFINWKISLLGIINEMIKIRNAYNSIILEIIE